MLVLVGAGLSARVGYPTYDVYAAQLLTDFGVTVSEEIREDASAVAETVKSYLARNGRLPEFHAHLERSFGLPGRSRDYDPVHRLLVRSGFRAVVTTNYDSILEDAVSADGKRCEEFDLCARRFPILDFLRETGAGRNRSSVLHLHGYFRNPRRLVITTRDYYWRYGPYYQVGTDGTRTARWRSSPHTRVLWTLFVMYPILFVGFSLRDPALRHILEVVDQDFERGGALDHYAIVGASNEIEEAATRDELARYGVEPIFYRVNPPPAPGYPADHSALEALVEDLCGITEPPPMRRGLDFTARMLA
jgi:hypothetical protein